MKKKILLPMFAVMLLVPMVVVFTACGGGVSRVSNLQLVRLPATATTGPMTDVQWDSPLAPSLTEANAEAERWAALFTQTAANFSRINETNTFRDYEMRITIGAVGDGLAGNAAWTGFTSIGGNESRTDAFTRLTLASLPGLGWTTVDFQAVEALYNALDAAEAAIAALPTTGDVNARRATAEDAVDALRDARALPATNAGEVTTRNEAITAALAPVVEANRPLVEAVLNAEEAAFAVVAAAMPMPTATVARNAVIEVRVVETRTTLRITSHAGLTAYNAAMLADTALDAHADVTTTSRVRTSGWRSVNWDRPATA